MTNWIKETDVYLPPGGGYSFALQGDITAYELALILPFLYGGVKMTGMSGGMELADLEKD